MKLLVTSLSLALAAGIATAQAPTPPAKGAPATPPVKSPPATTMPVKPTPPPAMPEMPKPPQQIADMAKAMQGTWRCTGTVDVAGTTLDSKATITHKVDLDKWYVQSSFTGTLPKVKKSPTMKFTMFTTYDAGTQKLWRVQVSNRGGHATFVGTPADKKVSWEGDARWNGADLKVRSTEEMVSAKEWKILGEISKDMGKTWTKDVEATCKK